MAYSDRSQHTHQAHDPYAQQLNADPQLRTPRSSRGAVAGLGVVVALIIAVIVGTSIIGGDGDTAPAQAPVATEQGAPASDAQDAPLAPTGGSGTAAPEAQ
ncbi:hypothetical protein OCH239_05975 [Roseivivax halodurans JCM 10272]|uniref:Uncharacterized protein n=1 Tax=Roseivivax halodurans JCM 10272 TaxID=1449350 RepID=X7EDL6_9RHOB|nr:hypothetical protein [Roseivivax halodurans]ETX14022.1 hypothetical protein OCH239_05975 [Roseivivax halodurans JCM 10272]